MERRTDTTGLVSRPEREHKKSGSKTYNHAELTAPVTFHYNLYFIML